MRALSVFVVVFVLTTSASAQYLKTHVGRFVTNVGGTGWANVSGATLGFTPAAAGDVWVILLSARLMSDGTGPEAEIRFQVNGTIQGRGGILNSAADKGSSWQQFYAVTGTTLRQDVTVQVRDASGPNAVTVEDLMIIAFKLPAGADFHYAEDIVLRSAPDTTWRSFLSLDVNPSSAGDYLVFAVANGSEAPSNSGIHMRLQDPTATSWPIDDDPTSSDRFFLNDRTPFRSFFLARRETLAPGSNPYTIEAKCGNSTGAELRYQRIMAFRTDVFDDYASDEDIGHTSTTGTAPVVKSTVTTAAPPAARDYVSIQSLYLDAASSTTDERRASFDHDTVSRTRYDHVFNAASQRVSYTHFDAKTTDASVVYDNTFSSSSGAYTVSAKESVIHVLRLPTTDPAAEIGLEAFGNKGAGSNGGPGWGDFNEDGCLDLAAGTFDRSIGTTLLMQDESAGSCLGTFTDVTDCLAPGFRNQFGERHSLWGDVDNDGLLDFVRNGSTVIEVYLNNGADPTPPAGCPSWNTFGAAGFPSQVLDDTSVQPDFTVMNSEAIALIDYDRDGVLELISNMHDEGMVMFENNGSGTFTRILLTGLPTSGTTSGDYGIATDLDIDGDIDLVHRLEGLPDIYFNNDDGTFTAGAFDQAADNSNKGGVAACDFDTDGDFDLFWTEAGTNQVWEQTGVGTFTARGVPVGFNGVVEGVACADIDNDGDVDLALTTSEDDHLFRNDGGLTFTDITPSFFGTNDGHGAAFADYDRDGDADLVIQQAGNLFLWKNTTNNANYLTVRALQDIDGTPGGTTRDAIGATIELLSCDGVTRSGIREVQGGHGHGSQDPAYVHIGLPTSGSPSGASGEYVVRVRFLDGTDIGKAIVPSSIGGYQLLTMTSTDTTDTTACTPTAVALSSFEARGVASGVELTWETTSELDNFGFHVHRSIERDGSYERVTSSLIPGLGSSPSGASYRYVDDGLNDTTGYFYRLEDIDLDGTRTFHGPVEVRAGGEPAGPAVELRVGIPDAHIDLESRRATAEIVLRTRGFTGTVEPDGAIHLEVAGLTNDSGLPKLRTWIDARACRGAEVVSVQRREQGSYALRPAGATAGLDVTPQGVVRPARRRSRLPKSDSATVLDVGYQGNDPKALIELSPFHWNVERSELVLAHELVVRVAFRGERGCDTRATKKRVPLFRFAAYERGVHRIALANVVPKRRQWDRIRLSRLGEPVAFHIDAASAALYFFSGGPKLNPYEERAVYELSLGGDGLRMPIDDGESSTTTAMTDSTFEDDRIYQAGLVDAPDIWLWDVLLAPETKAFPFAVDATAAGESAIVIELQGTSDGEHVVRVMVNDIALGSMSWSGRRAREGRFAIPRDTLRSGDNILTLENVNAPSMVMLNRFTVTFPRPVPMGAILIDVTDALPRWATAPVAGRRYFVADASRDVAAAPAREQRLGRGGADYLVIAPAAWLDVTKPLLRHRRRQGLRARAVSIERIYDEFGYGEKRPEAIRDFLAHAYSRWKRAPRYVVLLGDGSYDFADAFETGVRNQVPPLIVKTPYLWTASDPAYAAVHGDDHLPDLALGRLPAQTLEDASRLIGKIIAYERNEGGVGLDGRIVLVTDDADEAGDFPEEANALLASVLSQRDVTQLSLAEHDPSSVRAGIADAFNDGASVMSYIGHGGIHLWADENIFNSAAVRDLNPQSATPVVLTMNCLNGFFHFPYFDSLAESLLKAEGRGAIAAISPSGLSLHRDAKRFHRLVLEELGGGGHERIGDAWMAAQERAPSPEILAIYHLFGDPAMTLTAR